MDVIPDQVFADTSQYGLVEEQTLSTEHCQEILPAVPVITVACSTGGGHSKTKF